MLYRLQKTTTLPGLMADVFAVEGTDRLVLELLMFGYAHASRWILLKPSISPERFQDPHFMSDVGVHPSKYGRMLRAEVDLFRERDGSMRIGLR